MTESIVYVVKNKRRPVSSVKCAVATVDPGIDAQLVVRCERTGLARKVWVVYRSRTALDASGNLRRQLVSEIYLALQEG